MESTEPGFQAYFVNRYNRGNNSLQTRVLFSSLYIKHIYSIECIAAKGFLLAFNWLYVNSTT